ncbi:hypothetical protein EUGRSUZ_G00434 [Eucalyptus grandis]|uniref:Uncharacterized protein n=2 Tax=Eucalyptus grandis TaxID=71139 RepID=A0ACC3K0C1_EUCGR|nr:hypothetical protein EUGRSUZ_G00434 [Eucalyptus grandis]
MFLLTDMRSIILCITELCALYYHHVMFSILLLLLDMYSILLTYYQLENTLIYIRNSCCSIGFVSDDTCLCMNHFMSIA